MNDGAAATEIRFRRNGALVFLLFFMKCNVLCGGQGTYCQGCVFPLLEVKKIPGNKRFSALPKMFPFSLSFKE